MSRYNRTDKLEQEHAKRNPPKLTPPARFLVDGERVERLPDKAPAQLPPGAFRVERVVVDPPPRDPDDDDAPPSTVQIVDADGNLDPRSTMRDPEPEPPADEPESLAAQFEDDEPAPHAPRSKPRRKSPDEQRREQARESFERRTGAWNDQLARGLGRQAKKRRGIDQAPNAGVELKKAAKEGRVQVRGVDFFSKPKVRR